MRFGDLHSRNLHVAGFGHAEIRALEREAHHLTDRGFVLDHQDQLVVHCHFRRIATNSG